MDFITEKRTGRRHYLKDFTAKNPLKYAERLVASGHFVSEGDSIEVSKEVGIEVLETERIKLIEEREAFEKEKEAFYQSDKLDAPKRGRKPKIKD